MNQICSVSWCASPITTWMTCSFLYCDEATGERGARFDDLRAAVERAVTAGMASVLPAG